MGKGDKKTKKGKIVMGSFGVSRPHKKKTSQPAAVTPKKKVKEVKETKEVKEKTDKETKDKKVK